MMKRSAVWLVAAVATAGISVLQLGCGDRSSEAPPARAEPHLPAAAAEAAPPAGQAAASQAGWRVRGRKAHPARQPRRW